MNRVVEELAAMNVTAPASEALLKSELGMQ